MIVKIIRRDVSFFFVVEKIECIKAFLKHGILEVTISGKAHEIHYGPVEFKVFEEDHERLLNAIETLNK